MKILKLLNNKSFSILDIWNELIDQETLFAYESKTKFYHITDFEVYQKLLKN